MKQNEKGTVIVEAALVLPIVCLLLVGVLEFGRMLMIQQMITNAAREGARMGAIYMNSTEALSSATDVAENYLTRCGIDLSLVTVNPVFSQVNGTDAVQLQIDYSYTSRFGGWLPGVTPTLSLHSLAVMRREA